MTDKPDSPEAFRVVVFADFVCPYSFLAVDQIDRLAFVAPAAPPLVLELRAAGGLVDWTASRIDR